MIDRGLRLRDFPSERCNWRDLIVVMSNLGPDTAYYRACHPNDWQWSQESMLQASTVDLLNLLVWFKTKDGQQGRNRPKPLPRPGVEPDRDVKKIGKSKNRPKDILHRFGARVEGLLGTR